MPPTGAVMKNNIKFERGTVYMAIRSIDFEGLRTDLMLIKDYNYSKLIIDLFSFGGSVFDSLGMTALIREQQNAGKIIEIRARGIVASAGLIILVSGTKGHRFIDKNAMVMFHEMSSFKFMAMETPSDKEEEAKVFRKIQDTLNAYIAERSNMSVKELSEVIKKKEFWTDAVGAITYGFADSLLK
jgi:ATP-dependent protease ClpP protease subunit